MAGAESNTVMDGEGAPVNNVAKDSKEAPQNRDNGIQTCSLPIIQDTNILEGTESLDRPTLSQDHNSQSHNNHTSEESHEEKSYLCPYCQYRSTNSHLIRSHISTKHITGKSFSCPHCNYCCHLSKRLRMHVIMKHPFEKPYACGLCNYRSSQSNNLTRHLQLKHSLTKIHQKPTKRKPLLCPLCDYRCSQIGNMKSHIRFKHSKAKPNACDFCKYRSSQSCNLRRHVSLVHSKEKQIHKTPSSSNGNSIINKTGSKITGSEDILGNTNEQKDSLFTSEANLKKKVEDPETESSKSPRGDPLGLLEQATNSITPTKKDCFHIEVAPEDTADTNIVVERVLSLSKQYKCPYCEHRSNQAGNLKSHIAFKHSKVKPYSCPYCRYRSYLSSNVNRHVKLKHCDILNYSNQDNQASPLTAIRLQTEKSNLSGFNNNQQAEMFLNRNCDSSVFRKCENPLTDITKLQYEDMKTEVDTVQIDLLRSNKTQMLMDSTAQQLNYSNTLHPKSVEKMFQCPQCEHRCTQSGNLKSHIAFKHSKIKPYRCPYCNYGSYFSGNVNRHVRLKHFQIAFETIRSGFDSTSTKHITPISNEVNSGLVNDDNANVSLHTQENTDNGLNSQANPAIDMITQVNSPSSQIKIESSDDQSVSQSDNSQAFSYEDSSTSSYKNSENSSTNFTDFDGNLIEPHNTPRKEVFNEHSFQAAINALTDPTNSKTKLWIKSNDYGKNFIPNNQTRNFQCPYCDHRSTLSGNLKSHIAFKHSKIKPFRCPHCSYGSYLSSNVTRHVKLKHFDVEPIANIVTEIQNDRFLKKTDVRNGDSVRTRECFSTTSVQNVLKSISNTGSQVSLGPINLIDDEMKCVISNINSSCSDRQAIIDSVEKRFFCGEGETIKLEQLGTNVKDNQESKLERPVNDFQLMKTNLDKNPPIHIETQDDFTSPLHSQIKLEDHDDQYVHNSEDNTKVISLDDSSSLPGFLKSEDFSFDTSRKEVAHEYPPSFRTHDMNLLMDSVNSKSQSWAINKDSIKYDNQNRNFQCPYCDHRSTLLGNLKSHIAFKHSKIKPYRCPYCSYGSYLSSNVNRHVKVKHSDVGSFTTNSIKIQNDRKNNINNLGVIIGNKDVSAITSCQKGEILPTMNIQNQSSTCSVPPCEDQNSLVNSKTQNIKSSFPEIPIEIDLTEDTSCDEVISSEVLKQPEINHKNPQNRPESSSDNYKQNKLESNRNNSDDLIAQVKTMNSPINSNTTIDLSSQASLTSDITTPIKLEYSNKDNADTSENQSKAISFDNHYSMSCFIESENSSTNNFDFSENLDERIDPQRSEGTQGYSVPFRSQEINVHSKVQLWTSNKNNIKTDNQQRHFQCPYCDHRSTLSGNLKSHIAFKHSKIKPHRCPYCSYGSYLSSNVTRHVKLKHCIVSPLANNITKMQDHNTDRNNLDLLGTKEVPPNILSSMNVECRSPVSPINLYGGQNCLVKTEDPVNITDSFSETQNEIYFISNISSCREVQRTMETKHLELCSKELSSKRGVIFQSVPLNDPQLVNSKSADNLNASCSDVTLPHNTYRSSSPVTIKSENTFEYSSEVSPHSGPDIVFQNQNSIDCLDLPQKRSNHHLRYEENSIYCTPPSAYDTNESPHASGILRKMSTEEMDCIKVQIPPDVLPQEVPKYNDGMTSEFLDKADDFQGKPYQCSYCEYQCSQSSNLKVHIASRHLKVKPFRCFYCDYSSSQSSNVRRHLRFKHPSASTESAVLKDMNTSPSCSNGYMNPITGHPIPLITESNHLNNSYSSSCDFRGSGNYLTKQEMYSENPQLMVQNQRTQFTPGQNENSGSPSGPACGGPNYPTKTISEPMKITEREYHCPYCDYKTSQNSNLKSHIASRHSNVKPYVCSFCDYRSSQPSNFKRHLRLRHSIDKLPNSTP